MDLQRLCRALLLATTVLVATVSSPAPAAAQDGLPADIRAVSAVVPLRTDAGDRPKRVYRALLPRGYDVPAEPAVGFWLAELSSIRSFPGRPLDPFTHWIEGAVQLRAVHTASGTVGWFPIHYPVTAEFWFQAGRYVGLPKRHATASIVPDGDGWQAQATPQGAAAPSFQLDWQPDAAAAPAAVASAFAVPSDPLLVLLAPMQGPTLTQTQYRLNPPYPLQPALPGPPALNEQSAGEPGRVRVRVVDDLDAVQEADLRKVFPPGTSMTDLIVTDTTVPGSHASLALTVGSESKELGQGGYDGPPTLAEPQSPAPAAPASRRSRRCSRARSVTMTVRAIPGVRVRVVRAWVDGRRVSVRRVGSRRVRVALPRSGRTARRVTVTVVQDRGFKTQTKRTVRRCAA